DEPFSGLDAPLRGALRAEFATLQRRLGSTTILVTHDQAEALALGDRVAVLEQGRLVQCGTPREVYATPVHRFVADLSGSPPMHLLEWESEDRESGPVLRLVGTGTRDVEPLAIPLGDDAPGLAPLARRGRAPGRISLGIRAEHVAVCPASEM